MKNTIPIHVGPKFQGLIPAGIQAGWFDPWIPEFPDRQWNNYF